MTREEIIKAINDVLDMGTSDRYIISINVYNNKEDGIEAVVYRVTERGFINHAVEYRHFTSYSFFTEWLDYWKKIFSTGRSNAYESYTV